MIFTDNYQIPCLGEDDPGAVALYMKCLAQKIEEKYTDAQAALTEAVDHPTGMWVGERNHFTVGAQPIELVSTFWNDPDPGNSPAAMSGVGEYGYNLPGSRIGVYLVGLYCKFAGAVVGGQNFITLDARSLLYGAISASAFGASTASFRDGVAGTNLGGDPALIADTLVVRYSDTVLTPVCSINDGSIAAADIRMWVTYMGPPELVEVI